MKVEVVKNFRDKKTKDRYKVGQILEVSEARAKEMNSTKFGELVKKVESEIEEEKTTKTKIKKDK